MPQYIVRVLEETENVYFCDFAPEYHRVLDTAGYETGKIDVAFIPRNGRQRGMLMIVPRERVIAIHQEVSET